MKDKINRFANGEFRFIQSEISVSEEALYMSAPAGGSYKGSFLLSNQDGTEVKAILYSSDPHVIIENDRVFGKMNRILFCFDASNLEAGEKFNGSISIVSDCGEMKLPFSVMVEEPGLSSSAGKITDLFQFTNLARENFREAAGLFFSEKFESLLKHHNKKHITLYRHIIKGASKESSLEEFLIAVHKKLRIKYSTPSAEIRLLVGTEGTRETFTVEKDTWGYGRLSVICEAPYIKIDKSDFSTEDFVGNSFEVSFEVLPDKLPCGKNYTKITVVSPYDNIVIPVYIEKNRAGSLETINRRKLKGFVSRLTENYVSYKGGLINANKYISEAESLISVIKTLDDDLMYEIYRLFVYYQTGREASVKMLVPDVRRRLEGEKAEEYSASAAYACDYMEVFSGKDRRAAKELYSELRDEYEKDSEDFLLLIMMSELSKRFEAGPAVRFGTFRDQYVSGNRSPILYLEAINVLNADPSALKEADDFSAQILNFGAKRGLISKETALCAAYAGSHVNKFSKPLFRALVVLHEKYRTRELLTSICQMLIRNGKYGISVHKWYELGVNEQLKLTGLYEGFLRSMPEEHGKPLPQQVITYFSYSSKLTEKSEAFLYADIIINREKYPETYVTFSRAISDFARNQLTEGNISRDLALIYREKFEGTKDTVILEQLADISFKYDFFCKNPGITSVAVAHKELSEECEYKLKDGHAVIDIFTDSAELFPIDASGNRYSRTVDYSLTRFDSVKDADTVLADISQNSRMILHHLEEAQFRRMDGSVSQIYRDACAIPGLEREFKNECELKLIDYFFENDEAELLESYLLKVDFESASKAERARIIEYMISRDLFNSALVAIKACGYDGIDEKKLLRLVNRLILLQDGKPDRLLLNMASYVFKRGKHNETLLNFLCRHYNGSTAEMHDVWETARQFNVDTAEMEERLVSQTLFAETYLDDYNALFRNYYSKGAEKKLVRAWLSYHAYRFLLNDRLIDREILDIMRRELNYEENDICLLAVLKSLSGEKKYTGQEINFINRGIAALERKNMLLPFLKNFENSDIRLPKSMTDKHYIEYHGDSRDRVNISYVVETGSGAHDYITEPMRNAGFGIFVKEFVVFYNELLQYYITKASDDESVIEVSSEYKPEPALIGAEETKYQQLNLIITAREMNDEQTVLRLLESYIRNEYRVEKLFKPI